MVAVKSNLSILFLGKKHDPCCRTALEYIQRHVKDVTVYLGEWGDPLPQDMAYWEGDYIISYLSRWVVPEYVIAKSSRATINFHPASPEYPGIGCNNFALYENAREYGVTCHHMLPRVDTGSIIAVKRFPVHETDNVASLLERTYAFQLVLFYEIMGVILLGKPLPQSAEQWTREPFSRKAFNALQVISPDMDAAEIARRVRATSYGQFQPVVQLGDYLFELKPKH